MIYALSKLFTAFFLPPGLFVTALTLCALFAKKLRTLFLGTAILIYALSINPVADRLLEHYEAPFRNTTLPSHADAVVSLGGGSIKENPIPLVGEGFKRHIYGLAIARKMNIPLIVSGRGKKGYSEYHALLDSLKTLEPILCENFDKDRKYIDSPIVIAETKSKDTYENAQFALKLLKKKRATVIVVTSAYHMRRALALFRLAGVAKVYPAAINFYTQPSDKNLEPKDLLPSIQALNNSYRALHEFFGMAKVKLRELRN